MRVELFKADLFDGHSLVFVELSDEVNLELSAEGLVQERLFQRRQRNQLLLVDPR